MIRVKNHNLKTKKKKYLILSKGFFGRRKNVFKILKQSVIKSFQYSYFDRKKKFKFIKSYFLSKLNFFFYFYNINYNKFKFLLKKKNFFLNIKIIYEIFLINKNDLLKLIF